MTRPYFRCLEVEVKDYDTGDVRVYQTKQNCARAFGLTRKTVYNYIRSGKLHSERYLFRHYIPNACTPWPDINKLEETRQYGKGVEIRDVKTMEIWKFKTYDEASKFLCVHHDTIRRWVRDLDYSVKQGRYQIKSANDVRKWSSIRVFEIKRKSDKVIRVKIYCILLDGTLLSYRSKTAAAEDQSTSRNTIDKFLDTGNVDYKGRLWLTNHTSK